MKNREMLQHLPAEVSTELSLNYLVLTLKHHKCMENKIFRVMKLALTNTIYFYYRIISFCSLTKYAYRLYTK